MPKIRKLQGRRPDTVIVDDVCNTAKRPSKRERELMYARNEGYAEGRSNAERALANEKKAYEEKSKSQDAKLRVMDHIGRAINANSQALEAIARLAGDGF